MSALSIDQAILQDEPTLIGRVIKIDDWETLDLNQFMFIVDWFNLNFDYLMKADGAQLRFFIVKMLEG
jgi:hypothetical protein